MKRFLVPLFYVVLLLLCSFSYPLFNSSKGSNDVAQSKASDNVGIRIVILNSDKTVLKQLDAAKNGKEKTIYLVQADLNLAGKSIKIPNNCILRFDGGSFSNGEIIGNNTIIEASPRKIFDTSVTITGSWCLDKAYVEWFGCEASSYYDKSIANRNVFAIQKTVDSFKEISFALNSNNESFYYVTPKQGSKYVISIHEPVSISGINQVSTQIVYVGEDDIPIFYLSKQTADYVFGSRYTTVKDMCIRGLDYKYRTGTAIYVEHGVTQTIFENLYFCYLNECFVCDTWSVSVNNCKAEVANTGFRMGVVNKGLPAVNLTRCITGYCKTAFSLKSIYYSTMINCSSDYCDTAWSIENCTNLSLMTIGAEHCKQFMKMTGVTRNLKLQNSFVCVYKDDDMNKEEWNNYVYIDEKVKNAVFEEVDFEMNEPKKLSAVKGRDMHFIRVKGANSGKQSFSVINSYCSLGDINGFINSKR